jgi:cobalt/nickel transport system ATP-binding protein
VTGRGEPDTFGPAGGAEAGQRLRDAAPLLELRQVGYAYPGGAPVLRNVSFTMRVGERLALLGANGAGKSTLLQHLNGLLLASAGEVLVSGQVVGEASLRTVRASVGFVFQNADDQLFLPTLLEDVAFAPLNAGEPRDRARSLALAALAELGIERYADRAAHHLSGGEKRLAALATVLVSRPELLVLDEPTSELDARARQRIVRLLAGRPETLVVALHDLEAAAALCQRAVVLMEGAVAYDGELEALLRDEPLLTALGLRAPL